MHKIGVYLLKKVMYQIICGPLLTLNLRYKSFLQALNYQVF
jgi:hypothetical protein